MERDAQPGTKPATTLLLLSIRVMNLIFFMFSHYYKSVPLRKHI